MNFLKETVLPVLLATVWISLNEFVRNQVLFLDYWTDHYASLGLTFPAESINGAMWGVWSLVFAIAVFIISRKFCLGKTFLISWLVGFVLMWLVIGNMGVLPYKILWFAIPWSMIEAFGAAFISIKMAPKTQ